MPYKFLRIASLYNEYLNHYYKENIQVADFDYEYQFEHIMRDGFGVSDYLENSLKGLGYETHTIIENASYLQNKWSKEQGIKKIGVDLVNEQIKTIKPDVIYIQNTYKFNGDWVRDIKQIAPSVKLVFGSCCAPVNNKHISFLMSFDFIITCTPCFLQQFRDMGLRSFLIYHAFEPSVLKSIEDLGNKKIYDVFFAGSLLDRNEMHVDRNKLIYELLKGNINLSIFSNLERDRVKTFLKQTLFYSSRGLNMLGLNNIVKTNSYLKHAESWTSKPIFPNYSPQLINLAKKPIFGIDMLREMQKSKIGLNSHIDCSGRCAGNMRMFEVTGVGSCLLTDYKDNIKELFEPDKEIITYKSVDEAEEKIKWLLDNQDKLQEISLAGQEKTIKFHNYSNRAKQLDVIIKSEFNRNY